MIKKILSFFTSYTNWLTLMMFNFLTDALVTMGGIWKLGVYQEGNPDVVNYLVNNNPAYLLPTIGAVVLGILGVRMVWGIRHENRIWRAFRTAFITSAWGVLIYYPFYTYYGWIVALGWF